MAYWKEMRAMFINYLRKFLQKLISKTDYGGVSLRHEFSLLTHSFMKYDWHSNIKSKNQ